VSVKPTTMDIHDDSNHHTVLTKSESSSYVSSRHGKRVTETTTKTKTNDDLLRKQWRRKGARDDLLRKQVAKKGARE